MTKEEATEYLVRKGFKATAGQIYYNEERVGSIYLNEMYLAKFFPYLTNSMYHTVDKLEIRYFEKDSMRLLDQAVDELLASPRRFEEKMRSRRLSAVKRYFDKRRAKAVV